MSPFSIFVLAVSMSVDAFAVSVGRGAAIGRPPFREALRTGMVFDAMAVGVSLAFLDVNIMVVAIAIGLATFVMSSGGMLIGERFGKIAEVVAGVVLCALGAFILFEHLTA